LYYIDLGIYTVYTLEGGGDRVDSRQLIADTVLVLEVERGAGALQLAFRYHGLAV